MLKISTMTVVFIVAFTGSFSSFAGKDPFKKDKDFEFLDDVSWKQKGSAALKSGTSVDGFDTMYYHLKVDSNMMRLRLGANDSSGEKANTRDIDSLVVTDVRVDGQRLRRFDWCLNNQAGSSDKLDRNSGVKGAVCVDAGSDLIIKLDDEAKQQLKNARQVEFIVEPFGRVMKIKYGMSGFASIMNKFDKPKPAPVVRAQPVKQPVKKQPAKKVAQTCYAKPPADYASIQAIAYPCDNLAKKNSAIKTVNAAVAREKQSRQAVAAERERQQKAKLAQEENKRKAEELWERQQAKMWIDRCQVHWDKGVSPCRCQKVFKYAPAGVADTCAK